MSSLKDSEEQTSLWLVIPGRWEVAEREVESRGEQVASSHFSNTKASSGNSGWLHKHTQKETHIYTVNILYINRVNSWHSVHMIHLQRVLEMLHHSIYETAVNTSYAFSHTAYKYKLYVNLLTGFINQCLHHIWDFKHTLTHRSGLCGVWGCQGWWAHTVGEEAAWHHPRTPPSTCPPTLSSAPALHTKTQLDGNTENMRHVRHLCLSDIKSYCDFIMWLSCQGVSVKRLTGLTLARSAVCVSKLLQKCVRHLIQNLVLHVVC